MIIIDILNIINIFFLRDCGIELSKMERFKLFYYRFEIVDFCISNDEVFILINIVLVEIEDCYFGLVVDGLSGLEYNGRMYLI